MLRQPSSAFAALLGLIAVTSGCGDSDGASHPDAATSLAVLVRVHVPEETPAGSSIYLMGSFNGWDPAAAAYRMTAVSATVYELTLQVAVGTTIELNVTRGSLATVERDGRGGEVQRRTFEINAPQSLDLTVGWWADLPNNTLTGDVTTISVPEFFGGRRVWVYLPPGYATSSARYPVLYMFDGQNVFDRFTSFVGEWKVDETLEALIPAGQVAPLIVVAFDHGSSLRTFEYTPWASGSDGGGGAATLAAIVDVMVPYIDAHYRTKTGPEDRGIGGASLGGLMTLYAVYTRPDVFGRGAAMSPSIWWDGKMVVSYAQGKAKPAARVWLDIGTNEGTDSVADVRQMRDVMVGQGFVLGGDLKVVEDVGAGHNETAWSTRFPEVVKFLFPPG